MEKKVNVNTKPANKPIRMPKSRYAGFLFKVITFPCILLTVLGIPGTAFGMHITEGILPARWAVFWFIIIIPFVVIGILKIKKKKKTVPGFLPLVGIVGAAVFVFSCFPVPVIGLNGMATAHPAGTGMSAMLLGPFVSVVIAGIALFIQALFLAHGGLTTFGVNVFSMGILGSFSGYFAFKIARKIGMNLFWCGFLCGVISDIFTYLGTSIGLGLLVLEGGENFSRTLIDSAKAMLEIFAVFMVTSQGPLCIAEGIVVGLAISYIYKVKPGILYNLRVIKGDS